MSEGADRNLAGAEVELLETEAKYEGYIRRQDDQLRSIKSSEAIRIPSDLDYSRVPGLRNEARQKLGGLQPESLGQAGRISGVTPSDVAVLSIWLRKGQFATNQNLTK